MSRGRDLAKNTGIIALGTFLPRLASFVTLPILTGLLTKEEYGTYDLITVMVSLLLPALTLQIHAAAFRFLVDYREDERHRRSIVSNVFAIVLPISLVAVAVLFFALGQMADMATRLFICAYYLAEIIAVDLRQVARGLGRSLDYSLSSIVAASGTVIGAVLFVWWARMGMHGAVASLALAHLLSATFLTLRLRAWELVSPAYVDLALLKEMLSYSWPIVPNELSLWVMNLSDRLIVTAALGVGVNAVYAVANKIPHVITMAQSAFTLAWQENASLASKDDDASSYYSQMFKTIYGLQAGFFGVVIAAAPVLFSILIRGDYGEAYPQMPVLCLGVFFSSMATFLGGIYVAQKATKSIAWTTIAAAVVNIVLNMLLIRSIGLWAASFSTLISFLALFAFRMHDVRRLVDIEYDYLYMGGVLLVLLVESVVCFVRTPVGNVVNIVLALVAFVALNRPFVRAVLGIVRRRV